MKHIPSQEIVQAAYDRIVEKKIFKRSSLQERILSFLIQQSLKGDDVNEHSIGFHLFGDKYTADQNDSKIRVYVYYLRKKLEAYYQDPENSESLQFHIEKGQYNLSYIEKGQQAVSTVVPKQHYQIKINKKLAWAMAFGLLILGLACALRYVQPSYCWKPFLKGKNACICVLADHFTVSNLTEDSVRVYSVFREIRNEEQFHLYKEAKPNITLREGGFTLLSKMAPFGVQALSDWFGKFRSNFMLQLESETSYSDYGQNNIIFLGQSKTMNASAPFFLKNSKAFTISSGGYLFNDGKKEKRYTSSFTKINNKEYGMVSYQKLGNGKNALFFVSDHDIGVIATLRKFTSQKQLKEFYKKLPHKDSEFNALFEVKGLKRTELSCKMVELEIVE